MDGGRPLSDGLLDPPDHCNTSGRDPKSFLRNRGSYALIGDSSADMQDVRKEKQ